MHVGKTYAFRVIEYKNGGKDVVLSRRRLLEDEQRANADQVRRSIVPGAALTGRVVSVRDFGAFVDIGVGRDGLVIGIDKFGASAPDKALAQHYGFTPDQIAQRIERWMGGA